MIIVKYLVATYYGKSLNRFLITPFREWGPAAFFYSPLGDGGGDGGVLIHKIPLNTKP